MGFPDRIVREAERRIITGVCRTTAYELARDGEFPKPVLLTPSGRARGWRLSELLAWVESRNRAGDADTESV
jgi:prophage regulatory protein